MENVVVDGGGVGVLGPAPLGGVLRIAVHRGGPI